MGGLSFDEWRRLSESDPVAFVATRRAAIDAHIESTSPDRRLDLRVLQDEIDLIRARTQSANAMMRLISDMMVERVGALEKASRQLSNVSHSSGNSGDKHCS